MAPTGQELEGQVAVVTGGGRGIGAAISQRLAGLGATVVLCGRTRAPLEATAVAIREGTSSTLFVVTLLLAIIVMFDAAGVRRAASIQARILNQIIDELFQGHPISETRLRELIGHTPIEVVAGAALGIVGSWWWMTQP
jgi:NAD(P)-dependent dehydrogenase (short-subunit alcohol dehydrogenase family)